MSMTIVYVAVGTVLGVLQVGLGIAIGLRIRQAGPAGTDPAIDEQRVRELLAELGAVTSGITADVQGHQEEISRLNDRLHVSGSTSTGPAPTGSTSTGSTSLTELVVGVVGEVLRANGQLQHRLSWAESELQRQSEEITSHLTQALTDELTGLPNRRACDEQLRRRLAGYTRQAVPFSVLLIDIDYFKQVNDTHGHIAGDRVLCNVAHVLRTTLRKPDCVARYGGEEFAAILPCTSLEDAATAASHVRAAIEEAVTYFDEEPISVTVSLGVTAVRPGDDLTALVRRADDALYASKSGGRNCGHMHNGTACLPIGQDAASSGSGPSVGPTIRAKLATGAKAQLALSPELSSACGELRDYAARQEVAG